MNIKILDSWLREFLKTRASAEDIAKYLSLSGPSVERFERVGRDWLYDFEVTTNRVDMMSVYGIAREAAAILPRHGIKAKLKPAVEKALPGVKKTKGFLEIKNDPKLVRRIMAVEIGEIKRWRSPEWMKTRLEASGVRCLNSVVDITNYVMIETGHPTHAFDLDRVPGIVVRESKKGERMVGLDKKEYALEGGDIVFDDGEGNIIDLPGILGTANSVVGKKTKRVLFFIDNNDPVHIRHTSMSLGIRSMAAMINEKDVDLELAPVAMRRGMELFAEVCGGKVASGVVDIYPHKPKKKNILIDKGFIDSRLGVDIKKHDILKYLTALEFEPKWKGDRLSVNIPSFRRNDINIAEDIVEEIARIYGYYNLPARLMEGPLPEKEFNTIFDFEIKVKNKLKELGGIETYSSSLVSKEDAGDGAVKISNPLGADTSYMRTSLKRSLSVALNENKRVETPLHLFEVANVYSANRNDLPSEKMMLAGVMRGYDFRYAKGIIEALMEDLNIKSGEELEGLEVVENDLFYYEFELDKLHANQQAPVYKPIPKHPPQIEDITFTIPKGTKIGDVVKEIQLIKLVSVVELKDIYKNNFTFRIHYQDKHKNLTDKEVEKVRIKIIDKVSKTFGGEARD